jgi:hypothetical protein
MTRRLLLMFRVLATGLSWIVLLAVVVSWVRTRCVFDQVLFFTRYERDLNRYDVVGYEVEVTDGGVFVKREVGLFFHPHAIASRIRYPQPKRFSWEVRRPAELRRYFNTVSLLEHPDRVAGFAFARKVYHDDPHALDGSVRNWAVLVPHWMLAAVFGVLPMVNVARWAGRVRRRRVARRRVARGACGRCGYDLRGTTGLCPECGTSVADEEGGNSVEKQRGANERERSRGMRISGSDSSRAGTTGGGGNIPPPTPS